MAKGRFTGWWYSPKTYTFLRQVSWLYCDSFNRQISMQYVRLQHKTRLFFLMGTTANRKTVWHLSVTNFCMCVFFSLGLTNHELNLLNNLPVHTMSKCSTFRTASRNVEINVNLRVYLSVQWHVCSSNSTSNNSYKSSEYDCYILQIAQYTVLPQAVRINVKKMSCTVKINTRKSGRGGLICAVVVLFISAELRVVPLNVTTETL